MRIKFDVQKSLTSVNFRRQAEPASKVNQKLLRLYQQTVMPRGKRRATTEMGPAEDDRRSKRQRNSFQRYVFFIKFLFGYIKNDITRILFFKYLNQMNDSILILNASYNHRFGIHNFFALIKLIVQKD